MTVTQIERGIVTGTRSEEPAAKILLGGLDGSRPSVYLSFELAHARDVHAVLTALLYPPVPMPTYSEADRRSMFGGDEDRWLTDHWRSEAKRLRGPVRRWADRESRYAATTTVDWNNARDKTRHLVDAAVLNDPSKAQRCLCGASVETGHGGRVMETSFGNDDFDCQACVEEVYS